MAIEVAGVGPDEFERNIPEILKELGGSGPTKTQLEELTELATSICQRKGATGSRSTRCVSGAFYVSSVIHALGVAQPNCCPSTLNGERHGDGNHGPLER